MPTERVDFFSKMKRVAAQNLPSGRKRFVFRLSRWSVITEPRPSVFHQAMHTRSVLSIVHAIAASRVVGLKRIHKTLNLVSKSEFESESIP